MFDLELHFGVPSADLAAAGAALGAAGVSVEGGGMWLVDGVGVAHLLVAAGETARTALQAAGIDIVSCRSVLLQRLDQERPGQLGELARAMADAGVGIEVLYSDHDHRLVVCVDDAEAGKAVGAAWSRRHRR